MSEGCIDTEGAELGVSDGATDGVSDGETEGTSDGDLDGLAVGDSVGLAVGNAVGKSEAVTLGAGEGHVTRYVCSPAGIAGVRVFSQPQQITPPLVESSPVQPSSLRRSVEDSV